MKWSVLPESLPGNGWETWKTSSGGRFAGSKVSRESRRVAIVTWAMRLAVIAGGCWIAVEASLAGVLSDDAYLIQR